LIQRNNAISSICFGALALNSERRIKQVHVPPAKAFQFATLVTAFLPRMIPFRPLLRPTR
jgi:hypothetical protein